MAVTPTGLVVFVVSALVGGVAIHVGSIFALKARNYTHALVTAVLGALAWTGVEVAFAWADVQLGSLISVVSLVVWIGVVKWRYRAGWLRAGLIGLFAWIAALVTLALLAAFGVTAVDAYGVPGT
jgi:hypothetical protein